MVERTEFDHWVRDVLANLYDYAAIETHPLAALFPKPPLQPGSRAEHLRSLLLSAIEKLRPPGWENGAERVEWRPYRILHGRYVEGASLQELQDLLSLSARQLRREHSRALRAVAALLWDQAFLERALAGAEHIPAVGVPIASTSLGQAGQEPSTSLSTSLQATSSRAFQIARQPLDVAQVVAGVAQTFQRRLQDEGARLILALPPELPRVWADRVVLRQILLSLISHALHARSGGDIEVGAEVDAVDKLTAHAECLALWVAFQSEPGGEMGSASLETARYWAQHLGATLREHPSPPSAPSPRPRGRPSPPSAPSPRPRGRPSPPSSWTASILLALPCAEQAVVLVIEDQPVAIRMFQRYLSRSNLRVVGVQEPEQALPLARRLQPQAITLDVMMPTMDGWEILQSLRADPETRHIPIIVCSVWDEPELAASLGAAGFMKKPIMQKDLLDALARLRLVDMPAGSSPANP